MRCHRRDGRLLLTEGQRRVLVRKVIIDVIIIGAYFGHTAIDPRDDAIKERVDVLLLNTRKFQEAHRLLRSCLNEYAVGQDTMAVDVKV